MKKTILPLAFSMAVSLYSVAQVEEIPEKVYVNRGGTANKTDVYDMNYMGMCCNVYCSMCAYFGQGWN